jgi:NTP pyrophosphatase (non-canonical NTP hydrolase)
MTLKIAEVENEDTVESLHKKLEADVTEKYVKSINTLVSAIHSQNVKVGWYKDVMAEGIEKDSAFVKMFVGTKFSLIHSETSEAMEGYRKDLMDDHLPNRKMVEVELADIVIRVMDLAGYLKCDLGGAILEKLAYNQQRADHKLENRNKENGKKF